METPAVKSEAFGASRADTSSSTRPDADHGGHGARARALAAPTRSAILDHLRLHGPGTVKDVADAVGIHSNVARGHLDILVGAGLASVGWRRNPGGGRPAKVYEAQPTHVEEGPALVSDMLATLIELTAPAPETARSVAEGTGERLIRRIRGGDDRRLGFEEQVEVLLRGLGMVSGGTRVVERGENWVELLDRDCPFRSIAASHPEVACTLDKALKEGMVRALGGDGWVEVVTSVAWGDDECREVVRWKR